MTEISNNRKESTRCYWNQQVKGKSHTTTHILLLNLPTELRGQNIVIRKMSRIRSMMIGFGSVICKIIWHKWDRNLGNILILTTKGTKIEKNIRVKCGNR